MNSQQVQDMRLMYEAVYNDELWELANEYNNTVYDEDIVEVATEYFYTYGLNEDGINILIEKIGLESFVEYVYDLSEDLILTEARKVSKAKKQPGSLRSRQQEKLAAQRAASEKKEVEREEPESRDAESEAKAEQPKSKKPVRDAIARNIFRAVDAYKAGMERHRKATQTAGRLASETGNTLGKIASVTREAGRRAGEHVKKHGLKSLANEETEIGITGKKIPKPRTAKQQYELEKNRRKRKHLGKNVGGTQYSSDVNPYLNPRSVREEVELWINSLIEEGYDLSDYTWDEMAEIYIDEAAKRSPKNVRGAKDTKSYQDGRSQAGMMVSGDSQVSGAGYMRRGGGIQTQTDPNERQPQQGRMDRYTRDEMEYRKKNLRAGKVHKVGGPKGLPEEVDTFDTILEHLIVEGYADTNEAALAIMANMSEEWRESIVEAVDPDYTGPSQDPLSRASRAIGNAVKFATGQQTAEVRAKQKGVPGNVVVKQSGPFSTKNVPTKGSFISDTEMRRRGQSTQPMGPIGK
jgi:hypothetical protein